MAKPLGLLAFSGQTARTFKVLVSMAAMESLSSKLTKTVPWPSLAANSGRAPSSMVALSFSFLASMTEALRLLPLKAKTRWLGSS